MEPLLSQVVENISKICPNADLVKIRVEMSRLLAMYDIKPARFTTGHPDVTEKVRLFLSAKKLEGLSVLTLRGYAAELRVFGNYV